MKTANIKLDSSHLYGFMGLVFIPVIPSTNSPFVQPRKVHAQERLGDLFDDLEMLDGSPDP